jgi:hypothetical protein
VSGDEEKAAEHEADNGVVFHGPPVHEILSVSLGGRISATDHYYQR